MIIIFCYCCWKNNSEKQQQMEKKIDLCVLSPPNIEFVREADRYYRVFPYINTVGYFVLFLFL